MNLFNKGVKYKILFVASEAAPFVKVGGLGEVMYSLPRALKELGHDARVMIPKYGTIDTNEFKLETEYSNLKPVSNASDPHGLFISNILHYKNKNGEIQAYFLENKEFYEKRANTYGYSDDAIRWALLSKSALEFLKHSEWAPDVIVSSDWQTGLIPNYLHTEYKDEPTLSNLATVFSIHNLAFQGMFDHHSVSEMDYDAGQQEIPSFDNPRLLQLNFMRRGVMYADVINTVSPTYAQEITTPEYGESLNDLLNERRMRLFGILNGVDYESYNPEADPILDHKYSVGTLENRIENKRLLRKKFNLPDNNAPLLSIISRLTDQKGFGLLFDTARPLFKNFDFQLIILGGGGAGFVDFFRELGKQYPDRVAGHFTFDATLPRLILGAADIILIPSKYEPSGLTQLEAMRYGVIPVVRKTGGLADSVIDYDPGTDMGTGFVFNDFDSYAFYGTVARSLETYKYPEAWRIFQKRVMKADFSWDRSAREYVNLFDKAISFHKEK